MPLQGKGGKISNKGQLPLPMRAPKIGGTSTMGVQLNTVPMGVGGPRIMRTTTAAVQPAVAPTVLHANQECVLSERECDLCKIM